MARPGVPSTRFRCSVKAVRAINNLDTNPDGVAKDVRGDIAKMDIMLN